MISHATSSSDLFSHPFPLPSPPFISYLLCYLFSTSYCHEHPFSVFLAYRSSASLTKCTVHFRRFSPGQDSTGGRREGVKVQPVHPNLLISRVQVSVPVLFEALCNSSFKTLLNLFLFCVINSLVNKAGGAYSSKFYGRLTTTALLHGHLANPPVALSPTGPLARPAPTRRLARGLMMGSALF